MKIVSSLTVCVLLLLTLSCSAQAKVSGTETREKIAADITTNLAQKNYAGARKFFAKIMLDALSETKLKESWESVIKQMGEFQKVLTTTEEVKGGYQIIKKRCQFVSENATIQVAFNEENQVVGLYFKP